MIKIDREEVERYCLQRTNERKDCGGQVKKRL